MGCMVNTILSVLEELDSHLFEKYDPEKGQCLESLYAKLFAAVPTMSACNNSGTGPQEVIEKDSRIVLTLCEWATTDQRSGSHRGFVVAKLLERRQDEIANLMAEFEVANNISVPAAAVKSEDGGVAAPSDSGDVNMTNIEEVAQQILSNGSPPLFQKQLFHYLDNEAPSLDKKSSTPIEFSNLILLFHELITHDVFSHNHYLSALISR